MSTSHLKRHNEQCKAKHNVDIRNYMQLGKDECGNLKTFSYDESSCREGMIDYIIRAKQPFNMMETDSCHGRVKGINNICSYVPPTAVVKLLQHSGLGSNTGMSFHPTNDLHQCLKMVRLLFGFSDFC